MHSVKNTNPVLEPLEKDRAETLFPGAMTLCLAMVLAVSCARPRESTGHGPTHPHRRPTEANASASPPRGDRFSAFFPAPEAPQGGEAPSRPRVRRIAFRANGPAKTGVRPASYTWHYGDRSMRLEGVALDGAGGEMTFVAPAGEGKHLTLELREFRTAADQSPAYLVSVDGKDIAFRCRRYYGPGPASAFIDLPDTAAGRACRVTIRNLASWPLCLSEAFLYEDLGAVVKEKGLALPMYLGPTINGEITAEKLREIRAKLPDTGQLRPSGVLAAVKIADHPPETLAALLRQYAAAAREASLPLELQMITWWAGTPFGPDGNGGCWCDPEYQQINYVPGVGYSLAVPNRWHSIPWLTTGHERLNAFKAGRFKVAGQLLRELWDESQGDLPFLGIVLDNEVAYWGAGMPETLPGILADMNPVIVQAARQQGVTLDPADGLSAQEIAFLRANLLPYTRRMGQSILEGLGNCPLRERVFTHTWCTGSYYDNPDQAYRAGVLAEVHLGSEANFEHPSDFSATDLLREFGIPASINVEVGWETHECKVVPFAYATGSDRVSLFNPTDELLAATKRAYEKGWPAYEPVPWRRSILHLDFQKDQDRARWKDFFTPDEVSMECIGSKDGMILQGKELGQSNRTRVRLNAKALTGQAVFSSLALSLRGRAFVFLQPSDESYIAIRAGASGSQLIEVDRLCNFNGRHQTDLTKHVQGLEEITLELEFHPMGQTGWVGLFELSFDLPWEAEPLLLCNRSYAPERLRQENLLVGWRAEAFWALRHCEQLEPRIPRREIAAVRPFMDACDYRKAYELATALLLRYRQDAHQPWKPLPPDREERGLIAGREAGAVIFSPYAEGFQGRQVPLAQGAVATLVINGLPQPLPDLLTVAPGDDVHLVIENHQAVQVTVGRNTAQGKVLAATPATAFDLPTIQLEGTDKLPINSLARLIDRTGQEQQGKCPLVTRKVLFQPGDRVSIRWNPRTKRVMEAVLAQ